MTDLTTATENRTVSTPPLALRLRSWNYRTLERYLANQQVSRADAKSALQADKAYYTEPLQPADAIRVWRELSAALGTRNMPEAELAFVQKCFAEDAQDSGWSLSQLERAARAWRGQTGERFVPTFGQLSELVSEAKIVSGSHHLRGLHHIITPPLVIEPPKPKPKPDPKALARQELPQLKARLAVMEKQREQNRVERDHRPDREWGKVDEIMFKGLQERVRDTEARAA